MSETKNISAPVIVHWPGKDIPACDDHANKLRNLGGVLGFAVSQTPLPEGSEIPCMNCINEQIKR